MRRRMIIAAMGALGLGFLPSLVRADRPQERRDVAQKAERDRRDRGDDTLRNSRGHDRDEHRDFSARREHSELEHDLYRDRDRHFDYERDNYVPQPVTIEVPAVEVPVATVEAPAEPFCNVPVAVSQVPPAVLNATAQRTGGAPIVGAFYVHNPNGRFYDMRVLGAYQSVQTLRFGLNGGFYGYVR